MSPGRTLGGAGFRDAAFARAGGRRADRFLTAFFAVFFAAFFVPFLAAFRAGFRTDFRLAMDPPAPMSASRSRRPLRPHAALSAPCYLILGERARGIRQGLAWEVRTSALRSGPHCSERPTSAEDFPGA